MPVEKLFRPYLSGDDIIYILSLIEAHKNEKEAIALYHRLGQFKFKIANGFTKPAYVATEKVSIEDRLGLQTEVDTHTHKNTSVIKSSEYIKKLESIPKEAMTPEERFNYLAGKMAENSSSLTADEIAEGKKLELELYKINMGMFD